MKKLLVWGLDGVSIDILQKYIKARPNGIFSRIYEEGHTRDLISTIPFFTAPAWTTFMTGLDPGIHGVYHWRGRYNIDKKKRPLISSLHLQNASFWWYYQQFGGSVSISNFPMEYPAPPTFGKYICGTLAPESAGSVTWPPILMEHIRREFPDYLFEMDKGISYLDRLPELWKHIKKVGENHFNAMMKFGATDKADLLVHIVTVTDRAEHFFWHLYDKTHPKYDEDMLHTLGNPIFETLSMSENYLQRLWESGNWDNLIILSDHGMGKSTLAFHVDVWLKSKDYLFTDVNGKIDIEKSIAYAGEEPECSIYINLKSREGFGLEGESYDKVLHEIRASLLSISHPHDQIPLFKEIHFGKDIYEGPGADLGPDLIFVPSEGVHPRPRITSSDIFSDATRLYGNHRLEGMLAVYGKDVPKSNYESQENPAHIRDVFPLMCRLSDLPIPGGLSGSLSQDFKNTLGDVIDESWDWSQQVDGLPKYQDFNPQMIDRLKELGYM